MKRGASLVLAAACWAVPALALPTLAHADQVSESAVRLSFDVEATVAPRCGFDSAAVSSQLSTFMAGATAGDTRQMQFNLSCNTPFTVRVSSRNGGLAAAYLDEQDLQMAQSAGFATKMDYAVALDVPIIDMSGNAIVTQSVCASAVDMLVGSATCELGKAGGVTFAGTSDVAPAKLTVKLDRPTNTLIAGSFVDYITIDVGFAL